MMSVTIDEVRVVRLAPDDAEAERIKAERVAAYNAKKANKPKPVAKVRFRLSQVVNLDS